jgi:hypothetical protein
MAADVKYSGTSTKKQSGGFGHRLFEHNYFSLP